MEYEGQIRPVWQDEIFLFGMASIGFGTLGQERIGITDKAPRFAEEFPPVVIRRSSPLTGRAQRSTATG